MPLWAQLLDRLRSGVADGMFDEQFPPELEIADAYEVSRHTVREALRRLEQEGVLRRHRGKGTFVTKTEFQQPLGMLYSLFRSIEHQGVEQRSEVLAKEITTDPVAASHLGIAATEPLVYLERIRYAAGEPLAFDRTWLPAAVARPILEADFSRSALYDELAARCGIHPDGGWERIRPVSLDPDQCTRLDLEDGHAVFSIERLGTFHGRPIEWRQTLMRGDRFAFIVEWSPHGEHSTDVALNPI